MRFIKKTATGWADSVTEASSLMASKDIVSLALDTVDDMWFIKDIIVVGDKLIFGDPSSSPTSESSKSLLVKETEFDVSTSTLHVTGTLGKAAESKTSRSKKDLLDTTPNPTRRISISPESVITLHRDTGFSSNDQQRILQATQPDPRSEILAVVVVDKNFANANVRVLAGEETRFNDTVKVDPSLLAAAANGDQNGDGTSLPPSRMAGKQDRKPLAESKRKETKLARSAKGQNAPMQETLFTSAIDLLLANLDTEHGDPCPLLIASFGEAAHNFHNFVKSHAAAKHDKALLHMANNAIVVDTYGATGQGAAKADSDEESSKPTKPGKKGKKAATPKKSKDSSPSADVNGKTTNGSSTAKNEDCIWLPAYRQNITKKNMGPFDEMLMRPDVLAKIHNVRYDRDLIFVKDISERVRSGESDARVAYGVKSVEKAIDEGAVGTGGVLLVNKSLYHTGKFQEAVASLSVKVVEEGGEVRVLGDSHDCGQQLSKLGGIAAELTFPVFGLDELEDEEKK